MSAASGTSAFRPRPTNSTKLRRVAHRLAHVHPNIMACIFVFWIFQLFIWMCMMFYVQVFNPKLGGSVLYVTQISHWALVEAAGTAAISSWNVIVTRSRHRFDQLEADIAHLADLSPGPEATKLAGEIRARLHG